MMTSQYEWKILEWDEKPQTNKKATAIVAQSAKAFASHAQGWVFDHQPQQI